MLLCIEKLIWHEVINLASPVLPVSSAHKICKRWPFYIMWFLYICTTWIGCMWLAKCHLAIADGTYVASIIKLWLFIVACKQSVKKLQIWMIPLHFEFHRLLSAQWCFFTGNLMLSNNITFHVVPIITIYTEVCISSHYSGLWVFTASFQLLNPQLSVHWFKNLMHTNRKCQESGFVCMSLYKLL